MGILDLIHELDDHRPSTFLAPVLDADRVRVHAVQDNIPYTFTVQSEPGWWILEPLSNKTKAQRVGPPRTMLDVTNYLKVLPRFLTIALFRVRNNTWLVVPFNSADAEQRGWLNGEPRELHLVRHRIQPLDVINARQLGGSLIYGSMSMAYGHSAEMNRMRQNLLNCHFEMTIDIPGMAQAIDIIQQHIQEQRRMTKLKAAKERRSSVEEQLKWHLEFMGAELTSWHESGETYRVHWRHEGRNYSMDVARSGFLESAGVCLEGTDRNHNLSSAVAVMRRHRELGRTY